ncbi:MAG: hypothetical protein US57_C0006G0083 [Candidatus Moranbacteria bacterium GW2011_GWC2_37_73]|nr:MAG: hypothetical protein UR95_C0007G0086 [Parcubacteria group bacterium GW2011_GWC1_36_108]KKQ00125.1 MAG: hypothetical protein US09_C0020G0007 [Candidatus Moranbacteria bacterium GW2011_GWD1_36_198]KKQ01296.1 MAG: hypothetical protein US10_C0019G0007 [Candidatus Moranbacteria bacterium GW2011_GWD2_36_198]KKQ40011.1 MAG: hypothetical protein US57_C0006G0083 [Candidatus Moranbacteria bacterium GW2011_GWC2_37_73]HAS00225.1 hypothetical protein [Candidatus Moranbacteria bacterium]
MPVPMKKSSDEVFRSNGEDLEYRSAQGSPHVTGEIEKPVPSCKQSIFLKIKGEAGGRQALGARISEILLKIFGKTNQKCKIEDLSILDGQYLSEFFEVLTKIFKEGRVEDVEPLNLFLSGFSEPDLSRLQNLSTHDKIGNNILSEGIGNSLKTKRRR